MCGLVSVVSKYTNGFSQKQKDIFSTLLFLDVLRGDDSTGSFLVKNNGDLKMIKSAGNSLDFMRHQEYKSLVGNAFSSGSALVGHNRKATRGAITDENAHPFIVDDKICLVHNGTLWGDHKKHADVEVDSHAIAHLLAQHKVEDALRKLDGAFALIWHDFAENKLNFLRNSQRPLFWAETKEEWIWASEACMINFVADRFDLKFTQKPILQPEDYLTTFTLTEKQWEVDSVQLNITPEPISYTVNDRRACAWAFGMDDGEDEIPLTRLQQRTQGMRSVMERSQARSVFGTGKTSLYKDEMDMFIKAGNYVPLSEFQLANQQYPYNTKVVCSAFDTLPVNGTNDLDGMYLYLCPVDDPDVIIRYKYPGPNITENKAYLIALSGAVFTATVDARCWQVVDGVTNDKNEKVGFIIFNADKIVMENPEVLKEERIVH